MEYIEFQNFLKQRLWLVTCRLKGNVSSGRSLAGLCIGPLPKTWSGQAFGPATSFIGLHFIAFVSVLLIAGP